MQRIVIAGYLMLSLYPHLAIPVQATEQGRAPPHQRSVSPAPGGEFPSSGGNATDHAEGPGHSVPPWETCDFEVEHFSYVWLGVYLFLVLYLFLGLAIICDDFFVPSLEAISDRLKLSEDVAGATFMAAGSSAPELFTSVAGVGVNSDVGVGTIVGSAMFNILIIVALSAVLAGKTLYLDWKPLCRDAFVYSLSIVLLVGFTWDGRLEWYEASLLLGVYAAYIGLMKANRCIMALLDQLTCRFCHQPSQVTPEEEGGGEGEGLEMQQVAGGGVKTCTTTTTLTTPTISTTSTIPTTPTTPTTSTIPTTLITTITPTPTITPTTTPITTTSTTTSSGSSGQEGTLEQGSLEQGCLAGLSKQEELYQMGVRKFPYFHEVEFPAANAGRRWSSPLMQDEPHVAFTHPPGARRLTHPHTPFLAIPEEDSTAPPPTPNPSNQGEEREEQKEEEEGEESNKIRLLPCLPAVALSVPSADAMALRCGMLRYVVKWLLFVLSFPYVVAFTWTIPSCSAPSQHKWYRVAAAFLASVLWIAALSFAMVTLVAKMGCILDIDSFVMGLVVIAVGTSIPDAMSSILVARDGFGNMAVSNAIGSNVFDINLGLGLPFLIRILIDQGRPFSLLSASQQALFDAGAYSVLPHPKFGVLLLVVVLAVLLLLLALRCRMSKLTGLLLVALYAAFLVYAFVQELACTQGVHC